MVQKFKPRFSQNYLYIQASAIKSNSYKAFMAKFFAKNLILEQKDVVLAMTK